jgi:hypothetical protein
MNHDIRQFARTDDSLVNSDGSKYIGIKIGLGRSTSEVGHKPDAPEMM